MMEAAFKKAADFFQGELVINNSKVSANLGAKLAMSQYMLKVPYNHLVITLDYEFGNHNLAQVDLRLPKKYGIPHFTLSTKSQLTRLFTKQKSPWKVQSEYSEDYKLKNICAALDESGLTNLAKKEAFEPVIKGVMTESEFTVNTTFYLGFNEKEKSISPIILFYQKIIDILLYKHE